MTIKIDNTDILAAYNITLGEDAMKALLQWPSLKGVTTVDYPDANGVSVDLSAPCLEGRKIQLPFICLRGADIDGFFTLLKGAVTHTLKVDIVSSAAFYQMRFRLIGNPSIDILDTGGSLVVEVEDYDSFLAGYSYSQPSLSAKSYNYKIDDKDLSIYGLVPLEGSREQVLAKPAIKAPLEYESQRETGASVDTGATLHSQTRDITLTLWGHYERNQFSAYKAALYDLTRPNARTLSAEGKTFSCWYKSQSVDSLMYDNGQIDIIFKLTLTSNN